MYYYNARWYDPALGRFIQPDTIIPSIGEGNSTISIGYLENTNSIALTVDFHEIKFLEQLNTENVSDQRFTITPTNQIAYDRYAYTLNNPINYNDPNGHNPIIEGILVFLGTPIGLLTISSVIAAGVIFCAVGGPEALGDAIYQTGNAAADLAEDAGNAAADGLEDLAGESSQQEEPTTLQTGGNTLTEKTRKALGLTREQAKQAIEGLKKAEGMENNFHGKIRSDGSVIDPKTGKEIGNLYDYVP